MKPSLMIFRVLQQLLQGLHISVTDARLRILIKEQLYQDTLRTISEVLNDLNIEAKVYQIDKENISFVECPVIIHLEGEENKFVVVVEIQENTVKYYDPVTNKYKKETHPVFFEKWSGNVLIPFTDEQSGDPDYPKYLKEEQQKRLINTGMYAGVALCIVLLMMQAVCNHPADFQVWLSLLGIKMTALLVVSQIVNIELGESNTLITKVCQTTDCRKVLNSKASKLFSWLSMGDTGVIYFGFGTLLLIIALFTGIFTSVIYLLVFLNLFTLPYTFFSVGYQRFILKTWCPFCLTVMGLLWIEFLLGLTVLRLDVFPLFGSLFLLFSFAGLAVTISWFILKRLLVASHAAKSVQTYVNTVKKDTDLFKAILSVQSLIPELHTSSEIMLGNREAENVLIAVISPHCPSCGALYKSIKGFMMIHADIVKVILCFKPGDSDAGRDNQIIDYVLTLSMNNMNEQALSVLDEWYNMEYKDMNTLKRKCDISHIVVSDEAKQIRNDYQKWLVSAEIAGAPALIFNKKLVPNYYTFNDIQYFLKRL